MKIPSSIWTLLIGIVLTLVSFWYGQHHGLLPTPATDEALLVDGLFNTMVIVSTGIFLIVEGVLIYSAIKYRRRKGDYEDGPPVEGNVPLEILWTAIPAIIVIGISVYSFEVYNDMGGFDPHAAHQNSITEESMIMPGAAIAATLSNKSQISEVVADVDLISQNEQRSDGLVSMMRDDQTAQPLALQVNVTGLQYAWLFTYPETGITTGELHVPVNRAVEINMTANDVIHAFWVPEFRLKQDAIPGRQSEIIFTPRVLGSYDLICAELCGPYHGAMKTQVVVETPEAYNTWMQEQLLASKQTLNQALAVKPEDKSPDEFLAPYTKGMGIEPEMLNHVHHQSRMKTDH